MAVKVICAGFGRTGTLSLKVALEKLGFSKCHHMQEVLQSPSQIQHWSNVANGTPDWDAVFEGFAATADFPSCSFYLELAEHFPDAKVILTHRDADAWYKSVSETIYKMWRLIPGWLTVIPPLGKAYRAIDKLVWQGVFDGRCDDPEHAKAVFLAHNQAVVDNIAPQRLLVYQVQEGWGPLCEFLNVAMPDEPFPNLNDAAEMQKRIIGVRAVRLLPYLLLIVLILVLIF